jgi:hypothetical protein
MNTPGGLLHRTTKIHLKNYVNQIARVISTYQLA